MTGTRHYREAERLLGEATVNDPDTGQATVDLIKLTAAQVHATLALTAVHAADAVMRPEDRDAWDAATGSPARSRR